jgi:hypothetical protein
MALRFHPREESHIFEVERKKKTGDRPTLGQRPAFPNRKFKTQKRSLGRDRSNAVRRHNSTFEEDRRMAVEASNF